MTTRRFMILTPELAARVRRDLEDNGPAPTSACDTDEDDDAVVHARLAPRRGGPETWLFAYGSLIFSPKLERLERRKGTARDRHRSVCFKTVRFQGTRDQPGRTMSLERGGRCPSVPFGLSPQNLDAQVAKLVRREKTVRPPSPISRWVEVATPPGSVSAAAPVVMNRHSRFDTGRLPPEEIADVISKACGHRGACAEYLHNTVAHLEKQSIHDRDLRHLQELVAERTEPTGLCP
jgi:cation transport protein ChaC